MTSIRTMIAFSAMALMLSAGVQAKEMAQPAVASAGAPAAMPTSKATAGTAPMDINTASTTELATLPKIGEVRAAAILKGRPYRAKDELLQKKILPSDAYAAVKDLIIAKQMPIKK